MSDKSVSIAYETQ